MLTRVLTERFEPAARRMEQAQDLQLGGPGAACGARQEQIVHCQHPQAEGEHRRVRLDFGEHIIADVHVSRNYSEVFTTHDHSRAPLVSTPHYTLHAVGAYKILIPFKPTKSESTRSTRCQMLAPHEAPRLGNKRMGEPFSSGAVPNIRTTGRTSRWN